MRRRVCGCVWKRRIMLDTLRDMLILPRSRVCVNEYHVLMDAVHKSRALLRGLTYHVCSPLVDADIASCACMP